MNVVTGYVFRALHAVCLYWSGRRGRRVGVGGSLRPTVNDFTLTYGDPLRPCGTMPVPYEGSLLSEAIAPYLGKGFVFVAPVLGVNFIEAWRVDDK